MTSIESLLALRTVCIDSHSGQSSRGYKLIMSLSRAIARRWETRANVSNSKIKEYYKLWQKYGELL